MRSTNFKNWTGELSVQKFPEHSEKTTKNTSTTVASVTCTTRVSGRCPQSKLMNFMKVIRKLSRGEELSEVLKVNLATWWQDDNNHDYLNFWVQRNSDDTLNLSKRGSTATMHRLAWNCKLAGRQTQQRRPHISPWHVSYFIELASMFNCEFIIMKW